MIDRVGEYLKEFSFGETGVLDGLMNAGATRDMYDILALESDHEDHP